MGPWLAFTEKNNAIEVQRCVVPWLISLEGMKHSKSIKLDMIKEMLLALGPTLTLSDLMSRTQSSSIKWVSPKSPSESGVQQVS